MNIGDKVTLDNRDFLIIDINENVKIMDLTRVATRRRLDPGKIYEDKELDVYLNEEYLNSLSFKDKIITSEYEQYVITKGDEVDLKLLGRFKIDSALVSLVERKVCTPSLLDLVKISQVENFMELIGNETFCLRDAYPKTRKGSWGIANGKAEYIHCKENVATKPIMIISKEVLQEIK